MGRWRPDARGRMHEAALELFGERGYAGVTAAEVAERAGLTERTFFRHFADKREVLFADNGLGDLLAAAVAGAPEGAAPLEAVAVGLEAVAAEFEGRREAVARRARVVEAHAELRERELAKLAFWSEALGSVLVGRGLSRGDAGLLAEVSVAVFRVAYGRWLEEEPKRELAAFVHEALAGMGSFFGHAAPGPQDPLGETLAKLSPGANW